MSSEAEVPPDALVLRFKPMDPERCLKRIAIDHRDTGHYCLSVFADAPRPDETQEELKARLLAASELQGMNPKSNKTYWQCTQAEKLLERKFAFRKDGGDEVPEHYSVDFGSAEPTLEDVNRFIEAFDDEPEKRPR
ncbi:hypothetical protein GCM10022403_039190 [Streptomyces coacervatus]|uniref:Uncharacterized protein n=1 Tax=Streptomyces coacervatus TaxID=647381 RepID=A0ABP7HPC3_9ACTN|nr:hypothetical protein [Streptomyces coacervatus]MDF2270675.1 hypothetical protein [Streptomyces coacervatus]